MHFQHPDLIVLESYRVVFCIHLCRVLRRRITAEPANATTAATVSITRFITIPPFSLPRFTWLMYLLLSGKPHPRRPRVSVHHTQGKQLVLAICHRLVRLRERTREGMLAGRISDLFSHP